MVYDDYGSGIFGGRGFSKGCCGGGRGSRDGGDFGGVRGRGGGDKGMSSFLYAECSMLGLCLLCFQSCSASHPIMFVVRNFVRPRFCVPRSVICTFGYAHNMYNDVAVPLNRQATKLCVT